MYNSFMRKEGEIVDVLGNGVYSLSEASDLTGLRRTRIKQWFQGWHTGRPIRGLVFQSDYGVINGDLAISFYDLVELNVGGQLREHGLSLRFIRRVHKLLQEEWQTNHPFCLKEFRTDRKKLFACEFDKHERSMVIDVVTRQRLFDTIVLPFLKKLDYDKVTQMASKWRLAPLVVLNPAICFGKPIVEPVGITTRVLAASYFANGQNAKTVAKWFEIEEAHVKAAVEFEAVMAA
jgi:uncharacterized protein (DUF433 family)